MSSRGEESVQHVLLEMHVKFKREYSFPGLIGSSGRRLRFDFAIFDDDGNLTCLLEYQGRQHYIPVEKFGGRQGLSRQQANDRKKRLFCLKNNIRLITIPYYDYDKINEDYIKELLWG